MAGKGRDAVQRNKAANFPGDPVENKFTLVQLLKSGEAGEMLLLKAHETEDFYVSRHIQSLNLSFEKIAKIPNEVLPQIIYTSEDKAFGVTTVIEEYITGLSLDLWMKNRDYDPVNDEMAGSLFLQLADGVASLHKADLVHRALSPANVMLSGGRNIKVMGLSHVTPKMEPYNNGYKGMLGFAAPEQVLTGRADYRSDVYSLGMTMLHLLGAGYNGKYKKILKCCIAENPSERYSSAVALKEAIKNCQSLSISRLMSILFLTYAVIMGSLFLINHYCSPTTALLAEQRLFHDTTAAKPASEAPQQEASGTSSGSGEASGGEQAPNSEKKVSLLLSVPGDSAGTEKAVNLVVNPGNYRTFAKAPQYGPNAVQLPQSQKLVLTIKNNTKRDIMNPVFKFIPSYMNLSQIPDPPNTVVHHEGDIVKCQRDINIAAGSSMTFVLPLAHAVLTEPFKASPTIKVILQSDNYPDVQAMASFKF